MNAQTIRVLTVVSLLGCALVAGVFFAFSTFVMKALGNLAPARAIEAMQAINEAAPTAWFMTLMFGTAVLCAVLGGDSLMRISEVGAGYRVAGCALYFVAIVLTIGYHVPLNDVLATLDPSRAESATYWQQYLTNWTAWNHLRTLAPLGASALLTLALIQSK
ncbi:MAG TPA: anthrone oxygenase family protein [Polyangiaceae bacterium]|nr:anthrone oxygenase family protein [Polyangiaceae bacterium]